MLIKYFTFLSSLLDKFNLQLFNDYKEEYIKESFKRYFYFFQDVIFNISMIYILYSI